MRLFVAIDLPPVTRAALTRLQGDLRVGRHADPETFHVTLAFLDDQDLPVVEAVHETLSEIDMPEFSLRIRGIDVFKRARPRLVFAGVERSDPLVALHRKVRGAAIEAGIALQRQRFRPHVTLARFPREMPRHELDRLGAFLETHGDLDLEPFEVAAFGLYRSILGPDGAVHERLAAYELHDRGDPALKTP
ncbi:MAG: RNA 2',3'-cyclic phosphodiesterase [Pseudomonadota bacterium]|uniref:RNA 2',3'-cyclic phosphodiesterase n=1 Tax=Roseovarius TaxID=74030 RepID=UPI0022A86ADE|nr:RNA 2',3'-cyclic phosphodiesterase [Roseovarius sp. EGI FJ00037]MCZ0812653.1 RNA 2',3'-cyclic phosphodiesterase [Roseovarius sp. EGI FJ00037]